MHLDNIDYFRERAAAERKLAEAADNADAAAIHEVLARRYEALVREAGEDARKSTASAA